MIACSTVRKQDIRSHYNLRRCSIGCCGAATSITACGRPMRSPPLLQQQLTETLAAEQIETR